MITQLTRRQNSLLGKLICVRNSESSLEKYDSTRALKRPNLHRPPSGNFRGRGNRNLNVKNRRLGSKESGKIYALTFIDSRLYEQDIKNIKIVDYLSQDRKLKKNNFNMINGDETQSNLSGKPGCYSEQAHQGYNLFNEGSELKHSLIDVTKAYDYMNKIEEGNDPNKRPFTNTDLYNRKNISKGLNNPDSIDMLQSNQIVRKQSQGQKWSKILEYMRRNPKVLMQAIPSPRPEDKIKEALGPPNFKSLNENLKKLTKQGIPSIIAPGYHRQRSETEKDQSVASSHISKHTSKSLKGRPNQNSTKMVVMKPVPFAEKGSSIKKFRIEGKTQF